MLQLNMFASAIAAPSSAQVNQPEFCCSTGNCTWQPFSTLGFCSECTDLTPQIRLECGGDREDEPNYLDCKVRLPDPDHKRPFLVAHMRTSQHDLRRERVRQYPTLPVPPEAPSRIQHQLGPASQERYNGHPVAFIFGATSLTRTD